MLRSKTRIIPSAAQPTQTVSFIMPTNTHNSYVVGYEDGAFKPENNMTRAEAAAIFARNIAERKGEKYFKP